MIFEEKINASKRDTQTANLKNIGGGREVMIIVSVFEEEPQAPVLELD